MKYTEFGTMTAGTDNRMYENEQYHKLLENMECSLEKCTADGAKLFRTDEKGLYDIILNAIPEESRQVYNCITCRHFVNAYGGLVTVNADGTLHPVMWDHAPEFFAEGVKAVRDKVKKANIKGVFVTSDERLGMNEKGGYYHMSAKVPGKLIYKGYGTLEGVMAENLVNYTLLSKAVETYGVLDARTAMQMTEANGVRKNDKLIGHAKWFFETVKELDSVKNQKMKNNLLWLKSAEAPTGFCHLTTTKLGAVLESVKAGHSQAHIRYIINGMTDPRTDQRPQALPTEGNRKRGEQIVAERGIQNSLKRRFARKEEVKAVWTSAEKEDNMYVGVFGKVQTKESKEKKQKIVIEKPVTMTWEKFQRTVLPEAKKIEYAVRDVRDTYSAILTAADMDAPPIIQWDFEEERNPFNWYVYYKGSFPEQWGLKTGWTPVTKVALQPNLWTGNFEYQGKAVFFLLEGAKDSNYAKGGLGLFPAVLKSYLKEIAPTIEDYSNREVLEGYEEASACGIRLQDGGTWNARFRVETEYEIREYILDRWD